MLKEVLNFRADEDIEDLVLQGTQYFGLPNLYLKDVEGRMKTSHRPLFLYRGLLKSKMRVPYFFDYSSAFFYDLTSRQFKRDGRNIKFSSGHILSLDRNLKDFFNREEWQDERWVRQELEYPEISDSSLADFLNTISSFAPWVEDEFVGEVLEFPEVRMQKQAVLGAYIGFMPFYMKIRDRALNDLFNRESKDYPAREWVRMEK